VSDLVTLRHPKLPAEQTIQIDRRRMGSRLAAGWEEVKPEQPIAESPAEPEPETHPEPVVEPESTEPTVSASKRRGRNTTEEQ
jgi:hypothetical protein